MTRLAPSLLAASVIAAAALLTQPAAAEDVAAAKALFNKGLAEMEAGQYEAGCPAIAESYKLDPRPGTLFTLAECEAKRGRLATAVARYEDYLSMFARLTPDQQKKQLDRESVAAAQRAALGPLVPELTITLAPDAPAGLLVKRDGTALAAAAIGVALPVDPGDHVIIVEVPGQAPSEIRLSIKRGEKSKVVVPDRPMVAVPVTPVGPVKPAEPVAPPSGGRGSTQRTAAFVIGGVGVAGLGLGAVMGGLMLAKKGAVASGCVDTRPGEAVCDSAGKAAAEAGKTFGLISTIGFVAGLAGVGTAVVLFVTAPAKPAKASALHIGILHAGPDGAVAGLGGRF